MNGLNPRTPRLGIHQLGGYIPESNATGSKVIEKHGPSINRKAG
jgi:hypothetical protein